MKRFLLLIPLLLLVISACTENYDPSPEQPENVESVCYLLLHDSLYQELEGQWVRIAGRVRNVDGNNISIDEGLPDGLANNIYINVSDFNSINVEDGDFVIIVGRVGNKFLGQLSMSDALVEDIGENAIDLHIDLMLQGMDYMFTAEQDALQETIDAAIEISAVTLAREFRENEIRANERFRGNMLLVTGVVTGINSGVGDSMFITMDDGVEFSLTQPQFTFDDEEQRNRLARLSIGDEITVLGRNTGELLGAAMLTDCIIIE